MRGGLNKISIFLLLLFLSFKGTSATFYSRVATGNWTTVGTWSITACGGGSSGTIPGAGDDVIICNGHTITLDASRSITNVTINAGGQLTISGTGSGGYDLTLSGNLTVEGTLYFSTTGAADKLITSGAGSTINIGTAGLIDMTTGEADFTVGAGSLFNITGNGRLIWNPNTTTAAGATIFTNTTESFSTTSTLEIKNWYDQQVPLGSVVTGDFGNITFSFIGSDWQQDGQFSPNRIKGNVIVTTGRVTFDDGTGASTSLTLQDVTTNGTGGITLRKGAAPAGGIFTFNCNNFTINNTSANTTTLIDQVPCTFDWNVTGNVSISKDFSAADGNSTATISSDIYISGDLTVSGGLFDINYRTTGAANAVIDIDGTTTITAPSGGPWFRIIDSGTGTCSFTTGYLTISGTSIQNLLIYNNVSTGTHTFTIENDLSVSNGRLYFNYHSTPSSATSATNVNVGNDVNFTGPAFGNPLIAAYTEGAVNFITGRNFTINNGVDVILQNSTTGTASTALTVGNSQAGNFSISNVSDNFYGTKSDGSFAMNVNNGGSFNITSATFSGCYNGNGNASVNITGDFNMTSGILYFIEEGTGSLVLNINGVYNQDAGSFYGVYKGTVGNAGIITCTLGSFDFDGGGCIFHTAEVLDGRTNSISCAGNFDMNFTASTDKILGMNGIGATSNAVFDFDVGGDFITSGNTSGAYWFSQGASGNETIDILGNMTINGGDIYFNGTETGANTHNTTTNISGNLSVGGGRLRLSSQNGAANINVTGGFSISSGEASIKCLDGAGSMVVGGDFTQTGGTFYLHKSSANATADNSTLTVNGNLSQGGGGTAGTIIFDQENTSTATHKIYLKGTSCTFGGTGLMTRDDPGLATDVGTSAVFGEFYFDNTGGTITFDRQTTTHQVNQSRMIINANCIVNAASSTNYLQIACNNGADDAVPPATILLDVFGTLNMGTRQIIGRSESATQRPSSVYIQSSGIFQTANTTGFFDNSGNSSLHYLTRNSSNTNNTVNSLNWAVDANSIVEYNGTANQIVTGKFPVNFTSATVSNVASGTNSIYKYGKLKINQTTPGIDARAAASNIFIRTQLVLENGEFDLNPSGTGYTAVIENGLFTGILRNNSAYIRSETENAIFQWNIDNNTGTYVFPFGFDDTRYVPFSANVTTGVAGGSFLVSTWYTAANAAVPTGVTVCSALSDPDEQYATDRFYVITPTAGYTADIAFYYTTGASSIELDGIAEADLKAQQWNASSGLACKWEAPVGTVNTTSKYVQVGGVSSFSPWVLSKGPTPLPVELLDFTAYPLDKQIALNWSTATEINNDYFTVERSKNGEEFEQVLKIKSNAAGGSSSSQLDYGVSDEKPFSGISYYRLRQTDLDGKYSYSDMVAVEFKEGKECLYVYPVPAKNKLTLLAGNYANAEIKIYDVTGQLVHNAMLAAPYSPITAFDISFLSKGVYFISFSDNRDTRYARFLKE